MKRHGVDPFSLVFGATFTMLGMMFLFTRVDVDALHLKWVWPVPLIVLGVLTIALSSRREQPERLPAADREAPSDAADLDP